MKKGVLLLFSLLLIRSLEAQVIDVHLIDDFHYNYRWESFEFKAQEHSFFKVSDISFLCSDDTIFVNDFDPNRKELSHIPYFINFDCHELHTQFLVGNVMNSSSYELILTTNWGDTAVFEIENNKCSAVFDLRSFYNDHKRINDYISPKKFLGKDTLTIKRAEYECFSGVEECIKVFLYKERFKAKFDQREYDLSEKTAKKVLNFDLEIFNLKQMGRPPFNNFTVEYYFKKGDYLVSQEDPTQGKWLGFEDLKKLIIEGER